MLYFRRIPSDRCFVLTLFAARLMDALKAMNMSQPRIALALSLSVFAGCWGAATSNASKPTNENTTDDPRGASLAPLEIANSYFDLLRQGRGPLAVRRYWNTRRLAQRLYRSDYDALSPQDQAEVASEHERVLMGIYANPRTAEVMKNIHLTNLQELQTGTTRVVVFDVTSESGKPPSSQRLIFEKLDGEWRIVDMGTPSGNVMSEVVFLQYQPTGVSPLQYVRLMTESLPAIADMISNDESDGR